MKADLLDGQGRRLDYLRISLTCACNLRCTYCMPMGWQPSQGEESPMTCEEILALARVFHELGIRKIRLTGGEPLLRGDLLPIVRGLKDLGIEELALTTNGLLLKDLAQPLKDAGLDRVNVSLDTLDPVKYLSITRGGALSKVLEGLEAAKRSGLTPLKINTVLLGGFNEIEVDALMELTHHEALSVRFIELMPMGEALHGIFRFYSAQTILNEHPELQPLPQERGGVASLYRLPGYKGTIGFIDPISCSFCDTCSRLRLSATGKLRLCLHHETGVDLRLALRQGRDLKPLILEAVKHKPKRHQLEEASHSGATMNEIGG
ncbi:Cyclic pyranopterin monophosphate synthase [Clostridiaceae bacterium JG1575]|nr:Cyclic pyranopterin monophosphate synthase [Clostridiaceae bacterium JG1575]